MTKKVPLAIAYDFDGTLAPGNMQDHIFIPSIGMSKKAFWAKVKELSEEHEADNILIYMGLMLQKAAAADVPVRKGDFKKYGKGLPLFAGVPDWFNRINEYGKLSGVRLDHYIISSGLREIIEGTEIWRKFKAIFASGFWYDSNNVAKAPALALNYTTKTQYLFRINKGCLDVFDHETINKWVPKDERPVPFENIIYIGDGETDVPCFRLVKDQGGHAIAVFKPRNRAARKRCEAVLEDGRVNLIAPADFTDGSRLDRVVKGIVDKLAIDAYLARLASAKQLYAHH